MDAIGRLVSDANELERQLAADIAKLAAELEPLPQARDASALDAAWTQAAISKTRLARFIRVGLGTVDVSRASGAAQRRLFRNAQKELKATKTRLGLWVRLKPIVSAQLLPERRDLIQADPAAHRDREVSYQVVNLFFELMHKIANPWSDTQGEAAKGLGCHRDIPYPMNAFSQMIGAALRVCLALRRQKPLRFLDVGSGGGTKVLAAATCFDLCDGLEYDERTVTAGCRFLDMLDAGQCKLIHGDALRFPDYGAYDVIYFYRPMRDSRGNAELEKRIISQARRGTVLLNAGGFCVDDPPSRGVHELAHQVYIKGMTAFEASELVEIAELMGPMAPGFKRSPLSGQSYWKPLLEVSARNGYYI